jgi:hypothetical protein
MNVRREGAADGRGLVRALSTNAGFLALDQLTFLGPIGEVCCVSRIVNAMTNHAK